MDNQTTLTNKRTDDELITFSSKRQCIDRPDLPISETDIAKMIKSGYYADKTEFAWRLIKMGGPRFLIRPRRSGKSLFIETLNKICQGKENKEKFKKTFIYEGVWGVDDNNNEERYDWKKYPIINLDFTECSSESPEILKTDIKKLLYHVAYIHGISIKMNDPKGDDSLISYLKDLFTHLKELDSSYERKVIVLLDEYDAPVINLKPEQKELQEANKGVLKDFFKVLKAEQKYIHLSFTTGVTKFSLTDVVSTSDLVDISLWKEYAAIGGYELKDILNKFTDSQFEELFDANVAQWVDDKVVNEPLETAKKLDIQVKKNYVLDRIKYYYNGYKYHKDGPNIYNPVSVLSCFQQNEFGNYWAQTARSTMVLNQIKNNPNRFKICFDDYKESATKEELIFSDTVNNKLTLKSLLYQTGYLAIKGYENNLYKLEFSNQEVKDSLRKDIRQISNEIAEDAGKHASSELAQFFNNNEWDNFFYRLYNYCFFEIPYDCFVKKEKVYQAICNGVLRGADIPVVGESHNNLGRSDGKIIDMNKACIIEYKLNKNSEVAFNQAYKKYTGGLWRQGKNVVVIGINFAHGKDNNTPNHHNIDSVCLKIFSPRKDHLATFKGHFENGDIITDEEWIKP